MSVKKQAAAYLLSIDPETERLQVNIRVQFDPQRANIVFSPCVNIPSVFLSLTRLIYHHSHFEERH